MSEIMALHSIKGPSEIASVESIGNLLEDFSSRLSDISFSGGSIDDAISYFEKNNLAITEVSPTANVSSDEIFGYSVVVIDKPAFDLILNQLEEDCESGSEIAEGLLIAFEEVDDEMVWPGHQVAIIW
ncbi:hypothetical protein [Pseudomonas putida]|uniref:Uncharacterized protein n=1 Tax=Pseudomonas putida TaxID=303 RepID=A0A8I1EBB6_PSEPU|nr:hypothetical protein [Pseudomonas putida]MBI6882511.1 hypothetical protein [Pseudomonas putida]